MSQILGAETFSDTDPGDIVTSSRLNNMTNAAALLNGAVLDQQEKTITVDGDFVLLGDSALASNGVPKKVQIANLLSANTRRSLSPFAVDSGSANAYVANLSPAITAYVAGQVAWLKVTNANTGASTVNFNGVGAANITTRAGTALQANDILAGQVIQLIYDGTQFQLVTAISLGQISATQLAESVRGDVHQYQSATTTYGSSTYAVTLSPAATTYTAGMIVRFKAPNNCAAGDKIAVNGLVAANIFRVNGSTTVAVRANDIVTGDTVTVMYDGSNFVLINLARGWDFVDSGQAFPGSSAVLTRAHGLGAKPSVWSARLVCVTANQGYSIGDEINLPGQFGTAADATNITVMQSNTTTIQAYPKGGGALVTLTNADWNIVCYARI